MIKVPIKTIGEVVYYLVSDGELHHTSGRIEVPIYKHIEAPDTETVIISSPTELPYMLVDNQTSIPVVNANGSPVMVTESIPTGNYVMINTGDPISTDEQGNPVYDQVPDYSQPIMQNVEVQKTIGEYDMIYNMFFKQIPPIPIEQMIYSAIQRRAGLSSDPYVYIEV